MYTMYTMIGKKARQLDWCSFCKHLTVAAGCPCSLSMGPEEKCKAFSATADIPARLAALFALPDTKHFRE